ncbi:U6 snRNA methylphosphate capping enzyme Amus [Musca autumnalis]|uniref:U6 snRNA methylphosphate capping enzyme Amus n=1 Tax=Musca autumnalis TaxID=221902 RepID=UPI003CED9627
MNLKTQEVLINNENQDKEYVNNKRKCSPEETNDVPCKKVAYNDEKRVDVVEDVKESSIFENVSVPIENVDNNLEKVDLGSGIKVADGKNEADFAYNGENIIKLVHELNSTLLEEVHKRIEPQKPYGTIVTAKNVASNENSAEFENEVNQDQSYKPPATSLKEETTEDVIKCLDRTHEEIANKVEENLENSSTSNESKNLETVLKSPNKIKKPPSTFIPQSPKKRLEYQGAKSSESLNKKKEKFIYGNYSQYYGYRNKDKDFHDIRLDVFEKHQELFENKEILDIGCNSGFITMEFAKLFPVKSIVGLDIDKHLINQAIKHLTRHKKSLPMNNELRKQQKFPFNVSFVHGNYVLRDEVLLEIERPQFDVILCLSITKWIHLNFGDEGLKLAFRRMFLQLKSKGVLILEAQPFDNYARRKKMTEQIFTNYKNMKFFPNNFEEYLLSPEIGFRKVQLMGVPDHCVKGFKRPIQIFYKD